MNKTLIGFAERNESLLDAIKRTKNNSELGETTGHKTKHSSELGQSYLSGIWLKGTESIRKTESQDNRESEKTWEQIINSQVQTRKNMTKTPLAQILQPQNLNFALKLKIKEIKDPGESVKHKVIPFAPHSCQDQHQNLKQLKDKLRAIKTSYAVRRKQYRKLMQEKKPENKYGSVPDQLNEDSLFLDQSETNSEKQRIGNQVFENKSKGETESKWQINIRNKISPQRQIESALDQRQIKQQQTIKGFIETMIRDADKKRVLNKTPNLKIRHPFGAKIPITTENFSPTVRKWIENQSPLSAGAQHQTSNSCLAQKDKNMFIFKPGDFSGVS